LVLLFFHHCFLTPGLSHPQILLMHICTHQRFIIFWLHILSLTHVDNQILSHIDVCFFGPILTSARSDDAHDVYRCQSIMRTLTHHHVSLSTSTNCAYGWFYW
uniref:Secreted protein n=1 Tax=Hydatigena taeniaeformis TaxID=6205 RepID=A0A0R3X551_HYDTA